MKQLHKQRLGRLGEEIASEYLMKHGYRVLQRNFQKYHGELDIVCIKGNILVFVEVKTRIGRKFGLPEESVTPRKLQEVIRTADLYRVTHSCTEARYRIDVVAVELNDEEICIALRHFPSVTSYL